MLNKIRALYTLEPARFLAILAAAVIFAAARLNIVLDDQTLLQDLAVLVPVLLGGELTRAKVTPDPGPIGAPSDELLPDGIIPAE